MFNDCTSLITAPALLATELAEFCYSVMFNRCTSLITAPTLPATTLAKGCYMSMFKGCSALTTAPELKAFPLKSECYYQMFSNCTSLKITDTYTTDDCKKIFTCPTIGTITNPVTNMFENVGGIFAGDTPNEGDTYYWYTNDLYSGLKFTATQSNSKIGYTSSNSLDISIQCSLDNGSTWENWDGTDKTLSNVNDTLCVKNTTGTLSLDGTDYFKFTMSGEIKASGDVSSMINNKELSNYCFNKMFYGCTALISAPILSATTLKDNCYQNMFNGCTNLSSTPKLKADNLAKY